MNRLVETLVLRPDWAAAPMSARASCQTGGLFQGLGPGDTPATRLPERQVPFNEGEASSGVIGC